MLFKIKEANTYASTSDTDLAFDKLVEDTISNKSNIWTSSEMHENYIAWWQRMPQSCLCKTAEAIDDKLVVFSAPGLSSFLVFRGTVPIVFKLVDNSDKDGMIQKSVKQFTESVKILCMINKYTIRVDKQT